MFILINDRRVNLNRVAEYKPIEADSLNQTNARKLFIVRLTFSNGKEENVTFFNEEQRNDFLAMLDKNTLKT